MSITPTSTNPGTSATATTSSTAGAGASAATTASTATPAAVGTGEKIVNTVKEAGETAFNKTAGAAEGIWNGIKNSNLGPWQIGGMLAGGVLAWVIGNAFGGGGLLGMVISGLLAFALVPAGRNIFDSFDKKSSTPSHTQRVERDGPGQSRQRGHGQPVQGAALQTDPVTAEVFFGGVAADAREQARKAAQQMPPAPSTQSAALPMRPAAPASRAYP